MFSLKISKKAKENLSVTARDGAGVAIGALFVFFVELMFPRFSGSASVVAATAFFFGMTALIALIAARFATKASFPVRTSVFVLLTVAAAFFWPFALTSEAERASLFVTTQSVLFASAFFPVILMFFILFLQNFSEADVKKSALKSVAFAASGAFLFATGTSFLRDGMTTQFFLSAACVVSICCGAAYLFSSENDSAARDAVFENNSLFGTAFCAFLCFVAVGLALALSFRHAVERLPVASVYLTPLLLCAAAFVTAFSAVGSQFRKTVFFLQPFAVVAGLLMFFFAELDVWLYPSLAIFSVLALCCFYTLADTAKSMSPFAFFAAALTGLFVGAGVVLTMPAIFGRHVDLPMLFVLAATVRSGAFFKGRSAYDVWRDFAVPLALLFLFFCIYFLSLRFFVQYRFLFEAVIFVATGALCLLRDRPLLYALTGGVLMVFGAYVFAPSSPTSFFDKNVLSTGSFFGQSTVVLDMAEKTMTLYQEGVNAGMQYVSGQKRFEPQAEYQKNAVASFFATIRKNVSDPQIAVIGAGTGTVAAYAASAYEDWTYFEPDPSTADLLMGRFGAFTYYADKTPYSGVIIGEPLKSLLKKNKQYDAIIIDTTQFKTMPLYLLAPEALRLVLGALKPSGMVLLGISDAKLSPRSAVWRKIVSATPFFAFFDGTGGSTTTWVAMSSDKQIIQSLSQSSSLWR